MDPDPGGPKTYGSQNATLFSSFKTVLYLSTIFTQDQCCGSMKFLYGSGSADKYLWLMDPDPVIFVNDLQDINKNFQVFLLITFWMYIFIIFQRYKVIKKSQIGRNHCFSYYFCLPIEGSRYVSLTNGTGSGRPTSKWILRIRNRIRNAALDNVAKLFSVRNKAKFNFEKCNLFRNFISFSFFKTVTADKKNS